MVLGIVSLIAGSVFLGIDIALKMNRGQIVLDVVLIAYGLTIIIFDLTLV